MGTFVRVRHDADHQQRCIDAQQQRRGTLSACPLCDGGHRQGKRQGGASADLAAGAGAGHDPADALYRISIGKGYARVTSKSVIRQLSEAFGRPFGHVRCPAYYDEEEDMLIAQITDEGGDAS